jgi:hypothetical protein
VASEGWVGVDLDGTLAEYSGWVGPHSIGKPVPLMLGRVKQLIAEGIEVKIFTARVGPHGTNYPNGTPIDPEYNSKARLAIQTWCLEHIGKVLPITATKDFGMMALFDDRAIQVIPNTGVRVDGHE